MAEKRVKILHCADIHLDSPFTLLKPGDAETRRKELIGAFSSVIMLARTQKAQLVLISGDLFDSENAEKETAQMLAYQFTQAPECRFFITPGNHDPFTPCSIYASAEFPDNVFVFGEEKQKISIDELGVNIYGFGFTSADYISSPISGYDDLDKTKINILVCHGDITGDVRNAPFSAVEIGKSGFDYVALGHIHKGTGVMCENGVHYAYPGCIKGRSFDETGYKGVLLGYVGKGSAELEFLRVSDKRYEVTSVDISGSESKTEALTKIHDEIRQYTSDTVLRLILKGKLKQSFRITPADIGKGSELPSGIEIIDKTTIMPDFTKLESDSTLKGVFYRNMQKQTELCSDEQKEVFELALKYGMSALDGNSVIDYV